MVVAWNLVMHPKTVPAAAYPVWIPLCVICIIDSSKKSLDVADESRVVLDMIPEVSDDSTYICASAVDVGSGPFFVIWFL
jgi:hypothetical protein